MSVHLALIISAPNDGKWSLIIAMQPHLLQIDLAVKLKNSVKELPADLSGIEVWVCEACELNGGMPCESHELNQGMPGESPELNLLQVSIAV